MRNISKEIGIVIASDSEAISIAYVASTKSHVFSFSLWVVTKNYEL